MLLGHAEARELRVHEPAPHHVTQILHGKALGEPPEHIVGGEQAAPASLPVGGVLLHARAVCQRVCEHARCDESRADARAVGGEHLSGRVADGRHATGRDPVEGSSQGNGARAAEHRVADPRLLGDEPFEHLCTRWMTERGDRSGENAHVVVFAPHVQDRVAASDTGEAHYLAERDPVLVEERARPGVVGDAVNLLGRRAQVLGTYVRSAQQTRTRETGCVDDGIGRHRAALCAHHVALDAVHPRVAQDGRAALLREGLQARHEQSHVHLEDPVMFDGDAIRTIAGHQMKSTTIAAALGAGGAGQSRCVEGGAEHAVDPARAGAVEGATFDAQGAEPALGTQRRGGRTRGARAHDEHIHALGQRAGYGASVGAGGVSGRGALSKSVLHSASDEWVTAMVSPGESSLCVAQYTSTRGPAVSITARIAGSCVEGAGIIASCTGSRATTGESKIDTLLNDWVVWLIPFISAFVGWGTNVVAVKMMFVPVDFVGIKPFLGWQGIVPANAKSLAEKSTDLITTHLIDLKQIFAEFDAHGFADGNMDKALNELTDQIIGETVEKYGKAMWDGMDENVRKQVHGMVRSEVDQVSVKILADIAEQIDDILDLKGIVVEAAERDKRMIGDMFESVGEQEFKFIRISGLYFGFAFGIVQLFAWVAYPAWWVLPCFGFFVGYATNWAAIKLIFEPREAKKIGPITIHGLFHKRQEHVAKAFATLVSKDVINPENMVLKMSTGETGDRLFAIVDKHLAELLERYKENPMTKMMIPAEEWPKIAEEMKQRVRWEIPKPGGFLHIFTGKAVNVYGELFDRMTVLDAESFEGVLRPAFQKDEWKLILAGAVLGLGAGVLQVIYLFGDKF